MAIKRVTTQKAVDEKLHDKLKRDLDVLPANHGERGRIQSELNTVRGRMAARRSA